MSHTAAKQLMASVVFQRADPNRRRGNGYDATHPVTTSGPFMKFVNGRREQLIALGEQAATLQSLRRPAAKACEALGDVAELIEAVGEQAARAVRRAGPTMSVAVETAGATAFREAAMGAPGTTVNPAVASGASMVEVEAKVTDDILDRIEGSVQPQIIETERRASEKLRAFALAVDKARADAKAPAALKGEGDLLGVLNESRLASELEARGAAFTREQYETARNFGDEKQMKLIERAARPYLTRITRMTPQEVEKALGKSLPPRDGEIGDYVANARGLLALFDAAQEARMPPEVLAAEALLTALEMLFRELIGSDSRLMSPQQFAARYFGGSVSRRLAEERFSAEAGWATRWGRPRNWPALFRAVGHELPPGRR